jgi:hypothetical protein
LLRSSVVICIVLGFASGVADASFALVSNNAFLASEQTPGGPLASVISPATPPFSGPLVSTNAYASLVATYRYEALTARDQSRGDADVRLAGAVTCMRRTRNEPLDDIVAAVRLDFGFDGTGAEAVVAAALRTVCPAYDFGYRTWFDRNVAAGQELIRQHWGRLPDEVATGNAAKLVCGFLTTHSADGLSALLQSEGTPSGAPLKLTVRSVVAAHCPTLQYRIDNFHWTEL